MTKSVITPAHLRFFGTCKKELAASIISANDEAKKGQITCTDKEHDIMSAFFAGDIHTGSAKSNPANATKQFVLDNAGGKVVQLKLVYPKKGKNELRLYMSKQNGFRPDAGDIWYVYKADNKKLHIGYMSASEWERIGKQDPDDADYQQALQAELAGQRVAQTRYAYPRQLALAKSECENADYRCRVDDFHQSFISGTNGKPFVEIHHLVPLGQQGNYTVTLDCAANLVALCPNCHRQLHHGEATGRNTLLEKLLAVRKAALATAGIDINLAGLATCYLTPPPKKKDLQPEVFPTNSACAFAVLLPADPHEISCLRDNFGEASTLDFAQFMLMWLKFRRVRAQLLSQHFPLATFSRLGPDVGVTGSGGCSWRDGCVD
ncbi:HNH endonuclease [Vogesella sp. EB]|uniref:HNH endonuclease n=1 Tax=Vogesella sp. EB TaxID=1526735 RepID=UPI0009E590EA|nr:HNH endonuclease [Vogesella sp. EB]